jgi:hypothetical protein
MTALIYPTKEQGGADTGALYGDHNAGKMRWQLLPVAATLEIDVVWILDASPPFLIAPPFRHFFSLFSHHVKGSAASRYAHALWLSPSISHQQ